MEGNINRIYLHEAMKIVLLETDSKMMHNKELSDMIYQRGLYLKRDGGKAKGAQIRLRARNYSHLFEVLPGGIVKLKRVTLE